MQWSVARNGRGLGGRLLLLLGLADGLGTVEVVALAVESDVAHLPGNLRDSLGDLLLTHLDLVGGEQELSLYVEAEDFCYIPDGAWRQGLHAWCVAEAGKLLLVGYEPAAECADADAGAVGNLL